MEKYAFTCKKKFGMINAEYKINLSKKMKKIVIDCEPVSKTPAKIEVKFYLLLRINISVKNYLWSLVIFRV